MKKLLTILLTLGFASLVGAATLHPVYTEQEDGIVVIEDLELDQILLLNGGQASFDTKNEGIDPMEIGELGIATDTELFLHKFASGVRVLPFLTSTFDLRLGYSTATGSVRALTVEGSGSNISLAAIPKGTGVFSVGPSLSDLYAIAGVTKGTDGTGSGGAAGSVAATAPAIKIVSGNGGNKSGAGSGGAGGSLASAGNLIAATTGNGGAATSTGNGGAAGAMNATNFISFATGAGGFSSSGGSGGAGGALGTSTLVFNTGAGGSGGSAANGGAGGAYLGPIVRADSGAGGAGSATAGAAGGGVGGSFGIASIQISGGAGGSGSASGTGIGGAGGAAQSILTAAGGAGGVGGASANGGAGGAIAPSTASYPIALTAGNGGAGGSASGATGGSGGNVGVSKIIILAGNGGAGGSASSATGGTGGSPGSLRFDGGNGGDGGASSGANGGSGGAISLKGANAAGTTAGGSGGGITSDASGANSGGSMFLSANASYPGPNVSSIFADPEGASIAPPGSLALGAYNGTAWLKLTGTGNTGWSQFLTSAATSFNGVTITGSSTPSLAVTGTTTVSGANTGDQTITLTGAVTGSGTGSFATTLAADQARANLTAGSGALNLSSFTLTLPNSISVSTSVTTPTVIGGTGTTSDLSLTTTSGVGATGADMHFLVGNNGATEAMTILNSGSVGIGTVAPGAYGLAVNHATGQGIDLIYNDSDGSPTNHVPLTVTSSGDLATTPSGGDVIVTGAGTFSSTLSANGAVDAANAVWLTSSSIIAEGTTADANETSIVFTDPVADTTWNVPAKSVGTYTIAAAEDTTKSIGVRVTTKTGVVTYFTPTTDTDTARGLALESAWATAIAGDTIDLSPGDYYVAKAASTVDGLSVQYVILAGMTVNLNGARLYHTATENARVMFHCKTVDNWSLNGPGTLEGSGFGTGANEIGLDTAACRRYYISKVTFRYFKNTGLQLNNSTYSGYKFPVGVVTDCVVDSNNIGLYCAPEYVAFSDCVFSNNNTGIELYGANTKFTNCNVSANINYGLRIFFSTNNGHGHFVGGSINHNTNRGLWVESTVTMGFTFVGTHFYGDSTTSNYIELNGYGIRFIGGNLDCPVTATATPAGLNIFTDMFVPGAYVDFAGLSVPERATIKFFDCYTTTGQWSNNDAPATITSSGTVAANGAVDAANAVWMTSNSLIGEGATADAFEGTFAFPNVTADRTWTAPDVSGTLALAGTNADITRSTALANGTAAAPAITFANGQGIYVRDGTNKTISFSNGTSLSFEIVTAGATPSFNADVLDFQFNSTKTGVAVYRSGDSTTGLIMPSAGVVGFNAGGTATFRVASTGTTVTGTGSFSGAVSGNGAVDVANAVWLTSSSIVSEGATANGFEGTLVFPDWSADQTITFPDQSGTVQLVGGSLGNHFTDTSTTSTNGTEDDLYSDSITAGTFSANGISISEVEHVQFVSSATASRRLKKYFGGTLIFDSGSLTLSLGGDFNIVTTVIREDASTARVTVAVTSTSASSVPYATYARVTGLTMANAQILKTTGIASGTGAASGDIVDKMAAIK